jgi:hypothetical protein
MVNIQKNNPSFDMTTTQVNRALVLEMENTVTVVPVENTVTVVHKTDTEDTDKIRALLTCGPVSGEELIYVDLSELRQPFAELPDLFRCRCIFVDDGKGTIVYDNPYTFFKTYVLQCDNVQIQDRHSHVYTRR